MKCVVDRCRNRAVCRYCEEHRPAGLPWDLERPSSGQTDPTVDLEPMPSWMLDAPALEVMPDHIPITALRDMSPMEIRVLEIQWHDLAEVDSTADLAEVA